MLIWHGQRASPERRLAVGHGTPQRRRRDSISPSTQCVSCLPGRKLTTRSSQPASPTWVVTRSRLSSTLLLTVEGLRTCVSTRSSPECLFHLGAHPHMSLDECIDLAVTADLRAQGATAPPPVPPPPLPLLQSSARRRTKSCSPPSRLLSLRPRRPSLIHYRNMSPVPVRPTPFNGNV